MVKNKFILKLIGYTIDTFENECNKCVELCGMNNDFDMDNQNDYDRSLNIDNDDNKNPDNSNDTKYNIFTQLPKEFTTLEKWPKTCNLRCLYCDCAIDGRPIFIPRSVTRKKKKSKGKYINVTIKSVYGVFHHFSCAMKYINYMDLNNDNKFDTIEMLKDLHYDFTGKKIKYIPPADDKSLRAAHGGHMNDKEWKQLIDNNYEINSIFL